MRGVRSRLCSSLGGRRRGHGDWESVMTTEAAVPGYWARARGCVVPHSRSKYNTVNIGGVTLEVLHVVPSPHVPQVGHVVAGLRRSDCRKNWAGKMADQGGG